MSSNPMQRIADLEAQVAALTAQNAALKASSNGHGHIDAEKLAETVGLRVDRAGQLLREDFTGKLAGLISPYIDSTIRRCAEVEQKQEDLEKKFEAHRKAVAGSAAEMHAAFIKMRKEAAKDWTAQRDKIAEDFARVDGFVEWFRGEMLKNARTNNAAVTSCTLAVEQCGELVSKISAPSDEIIKSMEVLRTQGETAIKSAGRNLTDTYKSLRRPVLKLAGALLVVVLFIQLGFGAFVFWRNRALINTNWQELTEHSERQKQEMKGLLDKTLEEVKQSQIDRETKVKMWDELIKSLPPQQRQNLIGKLRWKFHEAEEKRLGDQMHSSYDQMNGTR